MTATLIGYARCSTDKQDLAAQQAVLEKLGVAPERIYTDRGLTGTNRARPGLDQALAAVRTGDTLVVPKLDRLARQMDAPDADRVIDVLGEGKLEKTFPKSAFAPVRMKFEDREYTAPAGAEEILSIQYGDWRTPPAEDDRPVHVMEAYRL